jgi:hypothetical protein
MESVNSIAAIDAWVIGLAIKQLELIVARHLFFGSLSLLQGNEFGSRFGFWHEEDPPDSVIIGRASSLVPLSYGHQKDNPLRNFQEPRPGYRDSAVFLKKIGKILSQKTERSLSHSDCQNTYGQVWFDFPMVCFTKEVQMPKTWSKKDERQYKHIKKSAKSRGESEDRSEEIAARTVNKKRRKEGRTKRK